MIYKFFLRSVLLKSTIVALFIFLFFFLIQCSGSNDERGDLSAREIAEAIEEDKNISTFACEGSNCCSRYNDCRRMCNNIFYLSRHEIEAEVKRKCQALYRPIVMDLEDIVDLLKDPKANILTLVDVREEFRLLLALDYEVWVRLIRNYKIDDARQALIWLAQDLNVAKELNRLDMLARNEILYELLAAAGDRTKPGAVEEGLSQKISFNETFFQHLVSNRNDEMLQMTHDMIRNGLCRLEQSGSNYIELCILRIYCRERITSNSEYIHPESLRDEIAERIEDEELFDYIIDEYYRTGRYEYIRPTMNDNVCGYACDDSNRGCE